MFKSIFQHYKLDAAIHFAEDLAQEKFQSCLIPEGGEQSLRLAEALNQISSLLKKQTKALREETSLLNGLLVAMREGVVITNRKGEIILSNPALENMFQLVAAPTGKLLVEVFRHDVLQKTCDLLLKEKGSQAIELNCPQETIVQVSLSSLLQENKIQGVVGIFIDITSIKRLEEMRKELVVNLSHEFKTPLSSIKGYSETLQDCPPKKEEQIKEFAQVIYRNASRLELLVEDIMALSRQYPSSTPKQSLSLVKIVQEAVDVASHFAKLKKINIKNKLPLELPLVLANQRSVQKILGALLENAIQYSSEGSSVEVKAVVKPSAVQIEVADFGPGIAKEELPRIFERFYRVEKSRSRNQGGSGLGLSIAKHLVHTLGGEVWAESKEGSQFFFTLPKA